MAPKTYFSWENFWSWFDFLVQQLNDAGQENTVQKLRESKSFVNGLTDGWHDFLNAFKHAILSDGDKLTVEQMEIASSLISFLDGVLKNR